MVETLKVLISVPGLIFLLLIAGAFLASPTDAPRRKGRIMVGLALVLFIGLGNGPAAYGLLETLENRSNHPVRTLLAVASLTWYVK